MGKGVRFTLIAFALTPFVGAAMALMNEPTRIAVSITWSMGITYWIIYYHVKWLERLEKKDRERCVPSLTQLMTRIAGASQRFFTRTREHVLKSGFITALVKNRRQQKS
jgi:hypothetical protein